VKNASLWYITDSNSLMMMIVSVTVTRLSLLLHHVYFRVGVKSPSTRHLSFSIAGHY